MGTVNERAAIALRSVSESFYSPYDDDLQRAEEIGRSLQADVLPCIEGKTVEDMPYFERLGFKPAGAKKDRNFGFYTFGDGLRPWITLVPIEAGERTLRHRHTGPSTVHVVSGELRVDRFERLGTGALKRVSKEKYIPGTICSIGTNEIHQFVCEENSCLYLSGFPDSCRTLAFLDGKKSQEYVGDGKYDTFIFPTEDDVEIGPDGPVPGRQFADDEAQTDRLRSNKLGGHMPSMESRVSMESRLIRLEVEFDHVRKDLDEIKAGQKAIVEILTDLRVEMADIRVEISKLPTSQNLFFNNLTVGLFAFAVVAVFITVLAYIGALPR